jgi:hypothetical protein
MGGARGGYGGGEIVHRVLMGEPEGKRQLRRPRRRWEDNIKMDVQEVGGDCGDWLELAQAGTCEYGEVPSGLKNAGNSLTSCRTG